MGRGMVSRRSTRQLVARSSGNVFADLRLPNPEVKQTKVRLALAINQIIEDRHLSQGTAARRLKINQPKISALSHCRLEGFSVERLMISSLRSIETWTSSSAGSRDPEGWAAF